MKKRPSQCRKLFNKRPTNRINNQKLTGLYQTDTALFLYYLISVILGFFASVFTQNLLTLSSVAGINQQSECYTHREPYTESKCQVVKKQRE